MDFTSYTVLLLVSIEKENHDLQKQIDNYNLLISNNISFIKDIQKELAKIRREVKK
jgi:ribosomal protein L18E